MSEKYVCLEEDPMRRCRLRESTQEEEATPLRFVRAPRLRFPLARFLIRRGLFSMLSFARRRRRLLPYPANGNIPVRVTCERRENVIPRAGCICRVIR